MQLSFHLKYILNISTYLFIFSSYFFLCSTTKYNMGQPPSDQVFKCREMLFVDTSMNFAASGMIGLEPFVRVFRISEGSPTPILQKNSREYKISYCKNCFTVLKLPVVSCDIDLISGATPQIFESIFLCCGTNLNGFPITKLRFVVDCITMNRCIIRRMRAQLHRQRIGGGGGKGHLR